MIHFGRKKVELMSSLENQLWAQRILRTVNVSNSSRIKASLLFHQSWCAVTIHHSTNQGLLELRLSDLLTYQLPLLSITYYEESLNG